MNGNASGGTPASSAPKLDNGVETDSDTESTISHGVYLGEDKEWEDAEDDNEDVTFVSLFDDRTFNTAREMLTHCKNEHGFDIWKVEEQLNLDDLDQIKLINYIRSQVKNGNKQPDLSSKSNFSDDKYLQPTLQDDALLYSLDDVFADNLADADTGQRLMKRGLFESSCYSLQAQFQNYRDDVQRTLSKQLVTDDTVASSSNGELHKQSFTADDDYFHSYSYNSIHHLMISDRIRTDGYRDFIYDNKDLFAGKTVLDVGCGTGILSMFCAKAGANQVIAVDNSHIISKARENIRMNKLDDRILCLRGKIEEVELPVEKVDIIVSEWMGYCLLYESMLDSVIYARDKYLTADGLMVPSHATLKIAPLADSELRISHIDFWHDVYGFNMTPMLEKAYEEVVIRSVEPKDIVSGPSNACTFKTFDLHTVTVEELSFATDFSLTWEEGFRTLEGFVIWFDIFFARDRNRRENLTIDKSQQHGLLGFSTGPYTEQTHWQQGALLIEESAQSTKDDSAVLEGRYNTGDKVEGTVTYSRTTKESRQLQIAIKLQDQKTGKPLISQQWKLE